MEEHGERVDIERRVQARALGERRRWGGGKRKVGKEGEYECLGRANGREKRARSTKFFTRITSPLL